MKSFFTLWFDELYQRLKKPSTYFLLALFFFLQGSFLLVQLQAANHTSPFTLQKFLEGFWLPALVVLPGIIAQTSPQNHNTSGCIFSGISLLTSFCVSYLLYILFWGLSFLLPYCTNIASAKPLTEKLFSEEAVSNGILFLLSTSFWFVSIGIFARTLTPHKTLAWILTFCFLFILFASTYIGSEWKVFQQTDSAFCNVFETLDECLHQWIDARAIAFHLLCGVWFLTLAHIFSKYAFFSTQPSPAQRNGKLQVLLLFILFIGIPITLQDLPPSISIHGSSNTALSTETQSFLQNLQQPIMVYVLSPSQTLPKNFYHRLYRSFHQLQKISPKPISWNITILGKTQSSIQWMLQKRYHLEETSGVLLAIGEKSLLLPFSVVQNLDEEHFLQTIITFQQPSEEPKTPTFLSISPSDFQTLLLWASLLTMSFLLVGIFLAVIKKK